MTADRAPHRYEEIASDIRDAIERGEYRTGDQLPGENAIMKQYGVARATARDALAVLKHEGLAVSRMGAGIFVQSRQKIVRDTTNRYSRTRASSTSPFRSDASNAGKRGDWEFTSEEVAATPDVARRLNIHTGEAVMKTTYRFLADGRPVQLSRSWEPLSITRGTPIERPEEGAITGVIARMDSINQRVDRVVEKVTARAARSDEVTALELPQRGAYVLVIDRTHFVGGKPIEICDIVFPGERYELTYTVAVPD